MNNSHNYPSKSRIVYAKESCKEPFIAMDDKDTTLIYEEKELISSVGRTRENNSNPRIGVHNAEIKTTDMPQSTLNDTSLENRLFNKPSVSSAQFI